MLSDYRKVGRIFVPPLAQLPLQLTSWENQRLPEYLWTGALLREHGGLGGAAIVFHQACDILERAYRGSNANDVFIGRISDFAEIPIPERPRAQSALAASGIEGTAFPRLFRVALSFYPTGPAAWLAEAARDDGESAGAIGFLRGVVERMRDGRGQFATQTTMLPFARLAKNGVLHFPKDVMTDDLIEAFVRYPEGTEEESLHVESFSRNSMRILHTLRPATDWPDGFWRVNFGLQPCQ